jgi:uncharacterized protein DUF5050
VSRARLLGTLPYLSVVLALAIFGACNGGGAVASKDAGIDVPGGCGFGLTMCDGQCVQTGEDLQHCGNCHTACGAGETCEAGKCVKTCDEEGGECSGTCSAPTVTCEPKEGTPYCADLADDNANCGKCGFACGAVEVCADGGCAPGCPMLSTMPETLCTPEGGADAGSPYCADLYNSPTDCGHCGHSCGAGKCQAMECYCLSPDVMCGGVCSDTTTDSKNCGGCGLGCAVACSGGECVLPLASGASPEGIAVDSMNVYVTLGGAMGSVVSLPLAGGAVTTIASGRDEPRGIAVDDLNIYWADQGSGMVLSIPKTGGPIVTLALDQSAPTSIALDTSNVYFTNFDDGTVMSVPKTGSTGPSVVAMSQTQPSGIAVDDTYVYWVNDTTAGGVMELAKTASPTTPPTELAVADDPVGVAVDTTNVYFTSENEGVVYQVPIVGGATVTLAMGLDEPTAIATMGGFVYYTDSGDGSVQKVAAGGSGKAALMASGVSQPVALTVDATSVYFVADGAGNTVFKVTPR